MSQGRSIKERRQRYHMGKKAFLTLEQAKALNATMVTEEHLLLHAKSLQDNN